MELLYDTLDTPIHKWEPLESISGTYDQDIVKNEMAELKFARPVHIKVGVFSQLRVFSKKNSNCVFLSSRWCTQNKLGQKIPSYKFQFFTLQFH